MRSKLGNAEAALDFLCELRELKCGTALEQKMLSKSGDIVRQFGKEVDAASMLFHERKACHCHPEPKPRVSLQSCHPLKQHPVARPVLSQPVALHETTWLLSLVHCCLNMSLEGTCGRGWLAYPAGAVGGRGLRAAQVVPPLARDEAPVSGAVRWSRTLFVPLKRTWTRLQREEKAALDDPAGARVRLPASAVAGTHLATSPCLRGS